MIATLVVEYADGTTATFASGTDWKTAIHAAGLAAEGFDDSGWKNAVAVEAVAGADERSRLGIRGFRTR
jgi:hypothetical protein